MRTARDVLTPLLCRNSMISRITFCSAQPAMICPARLGPMPVTSRRRDASCSMTSNTASPKARTSFFAYTGPMPRIMPEPRYFSIPSTVVGAVAFRNEALNWTPCVRSLTQVPLTWTNSPAEIIAAWPRTVIRSRCPRAFTRSTQNPFSSLWNVTRSTNPARTSVGGLVLEGCAIMEFGSSTPHAAHASGDIHPDALARATRHELRLDDRPGSPFEESEQLVGNKAGARGIDMAVALRVLPVGEEALRNHEVQIVLGTRHRDIEEAPFLLDLGRAAGAEVRRNAPIDHV